jgi:hypothetical protein
MKQPGSRAVGNVLEQLRFGERAIGGGAVWKFGQAAAGSSITDSFPGVSTMSGGPDTTVEAWTVGVYNSAPDTRAVTAYVVCAE